VTEFESQQMSEYLPCTSQTGGHLTSKRWKTNNELIRKDSNSPSVNTIVIVQVGIVLVLLRRVLWGASKNLWSLWHIVSSGEDNTLRCLEKQHAMMGGSIHTHPCQRIFDSLTM